MRKILLIALLAAFASASTLAHARSGHHWSQDGNSQGQDGNSQGQNSNSQGQNSNSQGQNSNSQGFSSQSITYGGGNSQGQDEQ